MHIFSSQKTEFFDRIEKILEKKISRIESGNTSSPHSNFIGPFRPALFEKELEYTYQAKQILIIWLFSFFTKDSVLTVKAFTEDVNETASREKYNIVTKGEKRTNKNEDLCTVKLNITEEDIYKENEKVFG